MPFHCFAYTSGNHGPNRIHDSIYAVNIPEATLRERFLAPYERGAALTWGGKSLQTTELSRIYVYATREDVEGDSDSEVFRVAQSTGNDLTNDFITGPPGHAVEESTHEPGIDRDPHRVMVVHGRNTRAEKAVRTFLTSLGLAPVGWEEAIEATGIASPHNLEAVTAAMRVAQAVVVIFTAEDEARLLEPLRSSTDTGDLVAQPRPNVFLEAGMAMALGRTRTVLTRLGDLRGATDVDGLNAINLGNGNGPRTALRRRLGSAGCSINDRDDYLDPEVAGDFDAAVLLPIGEPPQGGR